MDTQEIKPKIKPGLALRIALIITLIIAIGLAVGLAAALLMRGPSSTAPASTSASTAAIGPCYSGAQNNLPSGYSWYENATLGYKFAYPTSWGAPTLTTTPMGGVSGSYAYLTFPSKTGVVFGGNGTDYIVNARGGMPTDNPGFLEAGGAFYGVQIWQLHDASTGVNTPEHALYLIEEASTPTNACNTKALVTQYPMTDFFGYSYDLVRINLQPTNLYYGVNLVFQNPSSDDRADLQKIVASFQLIP